MFIVINIFINSFVSLILLSLLSSLWILFFLCKEKIYFLWKWNYLFIHSSEDLFSQCCIYSFPIRVEPTHPEDILLNSGLVQGLKFSKYMWHWAYRRIRNFKTVFRSWPTHKINYCRTTPGKEYLKDKTPLQCYKSIPFHDMPHTD